MSFSLVYLWQQIEDAMLMFDKQTNRHRGESSPPFHSFIPLPRISFRFELLTIILWQEYLYYETYWIKSIDPISSVLDFLPTLRKRKERMFQVCSATRIDLILKPVLDQSFLLFSCIRIKRFESYPLWCFFFSFWRLKRFYHEVSKTTCFSIPSTFPFETLGSFPIPPHCSVLISSHFSRCHLPSMTVSFQRISLPFPDQFPITSFAHWLSVWERKGFEAERERERRKRTRQRRDKSWEPFRFSLNDIPHKAISSSTFYFFHCWIAPHPFLMSLSLFHSCFFISLYVYHPLTVFHIFCPLLLKLWLLLQLVVGLHFIKYWSYTT